MMNLVGPFASVRASDLVASTARSRLKNWAPGVMNTWRRVDCKHGQSCPLTYLITFDSIRFLALAPVYPYCPYLPISYPLEWMVRWLSNGR